MVHLISPTVDHAARLACTQRVRCYDVTAGLTAYVIEFSNHEPYVRTGVFEDRFEVAVVLAGEVTYESARRGSLTLRAGDIFSFNPGELHTSARLAPSGPGVLVGFRIADPTAFGWPGDPRSTELLLCEPRLRDLARAFYEDERAGRFLPYDEVTDTVVELVNRTCLLAVPDGLEAARSMIENQYTEALYVAHLAEAIGMKAETFTRGFRRRFDITPIDYRLRVRLRAGRERLLACPDSTVTGVALQVGFESTRFFRMALRSRGLLSPTETRALYAEARGLLPRVRLESTPPMRSFA